jgi:hypothetical protein
MSNLSDWVYVPKNEHAAINFEGSLEDDQVVSGYVPVKSTLDVFDFLREAVGLSSPRGRAVICHGTYGTGKSRLCTVLARLFRSGVEYPALQPVWEQLRHRGHGAALDKLRQALVLPGRDWRPWLVVPIYADGGGGRLSTVFVRGLLMALRRVGVSEEVLGPTLCHQAVARLDELLGKGFSYQPKPGSRLATAGQMRRALLEDFAEEALQEFSDWHSRTTAVDFLRYLRAEGGTYEAHEMYPAVAERLQRQGYEGIVVLWDEFGFALEALLRGAHAGTRNLPQEAMSLQDFVERASGNKDLGKRVVFLPFSHLSMAEYGQRIGLGDLERDRLQTVAGRFRQPSIFIKLSVTELEGYHLLSGMLRRTQAGIEVFRNPLPNLQRLANRMPRQLFWQTLAPDTCYNEIVAPCYPLHPATAAALLLLSDRIAQVNRTAFYYLQDREEGGVAGALEARALPAPDDAGGKELLRVSDLIPFFTEPLREKESQLVDQFEQAAARLPDATSLEVAVLRAVLVLSGIRNGEMAPTTDFLSFCLCDVQRAEIGAAPLHQALSRLKEAGALWKNEATDVWNFVSDRGFGQDLEKELDQEKALVPRDKKPGELLRLYDVLREDITDRLGVSDLDPCEAGIVRTINVELFDPTKDDKALSAPNAAVRGQGDRWLSAVVYLAAVDTAAQLDACRKLADVPTRETVYVVLPGAPLALSADKARELIAVRKLLQTKDSQSYAYEVLENKLTRLREDLRAEFEKSFGNEGLRTGTAVLKAGQPARPVPVTSWGQLLPSIGRDLDTAFCHQPRVRCGTFNEWQNVPTSLWNKIENIVEAILKFDDKPEYQNEFFNHNSTSQEAAVIDGVLVENDFFHHNSASGKWELITASPDVPSEVLRAVLRHLAMRGAGDKPFLKLYEQLIEPPFGVPNGIIPLLVALVFRAEPARIGVYHQRTRNWERVESNLAEAIVGMARFPDRYQTRYSKLSPKQRFVFRVLGAEFDVRVPDSGPVEKLEEACDKVAAALRALVRELPEAAVALPDLTEPQRDVLKSLRGGVPPQLTLLADHLTRMIQDDPEARQELDDAGNSRTTFPAMVRLWRDFRERLDRQREGARAAVRRQLQNVGNDRQGVVEALKKAAVITGPDNKVLGSIVQRLAASSGQADLSDEIVAAVTGKPARQLGQEDYGRTSGILEVVQALAPPAGRVTVVMPDGQRHDLPVFVHEQAGAQIREAVRGWQTAFSLSADQMVALLLNAVYAGEGPAPSAPAPAAEAQKAADPAATS